MTPEEAEKVARAVMAGCGDSYYYDSLAATLDAAFPEFDWPTLLLLSEREELAETIGFHAKGEVSAENVEWQRNHIAELETEMRETIAASRTEAAAE